MNSPIIHETIPAHKTPDIWNDDTIPAWAFEPTDLDCWDPPLARGCSFCGEYAEPGTDWCARHLASEGPEVRLVAGMVFRCESFSRPNVWYTVSLAGVVPACSCPARKPCKHPAHVRLHVARLQLAQRAVWTADRATRQDRLDDLKVALGLRPAARVVGEAA